MGSSRFAQAVVARRSHATENPFFTILTLGKTVELGYQKALPWGTCATLGSVFALSWKGIALKNLTVRKLSGLTAVSALAGLLAAAVTPAQATTFSGTFADYSAVFGSTINLDWTHTGPTTGTLATPGAVPVYFTFLNPTLASLANISALFTLSASTDQAATHGASQVIQNDIAGSFSFTSVNSFMVGGQSYAAGTLLLGGTFDDAVLSGPNGGSTGGVQDSRLSTPPGTVVFTSGILASQLAFNPTGDEGLGLSMSDVKPNLSALAGQSLNKFSSSSVGTFAADLSTGGGSKTPEPATWVMMLIGVGAIGFAVRRRVKVSALA
jgi:PEP-CTERM motif